MRSTNILFGLGSLALLALGVITTSACSGYKRCSAFASPAEGRASEPSPSPVSGNAGPNDSAGAAGAAGTRAIAEADIVQLDDEQDRIYAMSRSGWLAIVDAAQPGKLSLMGKVGLSGEPFEMY